MTALNSFSNGKLSLESLCYYSQYSSSSLQKLPLFLLLPLSKALCSFFPPCNRKRCNITPQTRPKSNPPPCSCQTLLHNGLKILEYPLATCQTLIAYLKDHSSHATLSYQLPKVPQSGENQPSKYPKDL